MAQPLADYLNVLIGREEQRCVRVAQVIQANLREFCGGEYRAEVSMSEIGDR